MKIKQLFEIFRVFFKIGIVTFGGGYAMLPILQHELVSKRGWLCDEEIMDYFAIGQSLPGIIAVNVATFSGNKKYGFWGALFAVLGVISPSILIIGIIAASISSFSSYIWVQKALKGINVGVAVLLTQATFAMAKKSIVDVLTIVIALASFIFITWFSVSTVLVLILAICVGILAKGGKK